MSRSSAPMLKIQATNCRYEGRKFSRDKQRGGAADPNGVTKPRGHVSAMLTMVESEARDSRVACSVGSAEMSL